MEQAEEEQKRFTREQVKASYERAVADLTNIENRFKEEQHNLSVAVKKESQALLNDIEQRNNDLIGENYSRTLQQMLDIERRLNEQQREMVSRVQQDG